MRQTREKATTLRQVTCSSAIAQIRTEVLKADKVVMLFKSLEFISQDNPHPASSSTFK